MMPPDHVMPPGFIPPQEPRYVDRDGKPRQPSEFEVVEHRRKVIFAMAEHCDWGRYKGDHAMPSLGGKLRVRMKFERGQYDYFVDAE